MAIEFRFDHLFFFSFWLICRYNNGGEGIVYPGFSGSNNGNNNNGGNNEGYDGGNTVINNSPIYGNNGGGTATDQDFYGMIFKAAATHKSTSPYIINLCTQIIILLYILTINNYSFLFTL